MEDVAMPSTGATAATEEAAAAAIPTARRYNQPYKFVGRIVVRRSRIIMNTEYQVYYMTT